MTKNKNCFSSDKGKCATNSKSFSFGEINKYVITRKICVPFK